jgi:hypothetical protein
VRLGDRAFFTLCETLVASSRPLRECGEWELKGVRCSLQRQSSWDTYSSHQIEILRFHRPGRTGWTVLLVHEIWWSGKREKAIRNARWAHQVDGSRTEALRWFAERLKEIEED